MSDKVVTIPILPELPVGAVFQFRDKKTRYRVVEVNFDNVVNLGYSVCDDCAFHLVTWASVPMEQACARFERTARLEDVERFARGVHRVYRDDLATLFGACVGNGLEYLELCFACFLMAPAEVEPHFANEPNIFGN